MSDELFDEARRIVIDSKSTSIQHLQRRLHITFWRAATLMDELEAAGVVSSPTLGRARVVIDRDAQR